MLKKISPKISSAKWGEIITDEGKRYKDVKLFPGGSREWDWNETGTHHRSGIQSTDINELLEQGASVIVLSQGFYKRLQVKDETIELLKRKGVEYYILETGKAVKKYNELSENRMTAALIHSTC